MSSFFVAKSCRGWLRSGRNEGWVDDIDFATRYATEKKAENACLASARHWGCYHDLYPEIDFNEFITSLVVEKYEVVVAEQVSLGDKPMIAFKKAQEQRKREISDWHVRENEEKRAKLRRAEEEVERLKREIDNA